MYVVDFIVFLLAIESYLRSKVHAHHSAYNFVSAFLVQLPEIGDIIKCQNVNKYYFSMSASLSFLSYCRCTITTISRLQMQYVREAHQSLSVN